MALLHRTTSNTLLDLNDDCLLNIMELLSLTDTFNLIGVLDSRVDAVAYRRIAMCKQLDLSMRTVPNYTADQLEIIGRNLRSLSLSAGYSLPVDTVLQILQPLCVGAAGAALQELRLHYVNYDANYAEVLRGVTPQLKHIDLSHCQLTDEMLAPFLRECANLREFKAIGNYTLAGESLHSLNWPLLRILEIEMHEQWTVDLSGIHSRHPHIRIIAHSQGRGTKTEYSPIKTEEMS